MPDSQVTRNPRGIEGKHPHTGQSGSRHKRAQLIGPKGEKMPVAVGEKLTIFQGGSIAKVGETGQ